MLRFKKGTKEHNLPCERMLNLLAHAQSIELDIGSQCGGHGVCGGDQVFVDAKSRALLSPPTEIEIEHLGAENVAAGWRLACQCFPSEDGAELEVKVKP